MAKYTVTYSCGHDDVVELFGKVEERKKKLNTLKKTAYAANATKKRWKKLQKQKDWFSMLPFYQELIYLTEAIC